MQREAELGHKRYVARKCPSGEFGLYIHGKPLERYPFHALGIDRIRSCNTHASNAQEQYSRSQRLNICERRTLEPAADTTFGRCRSIPLLWRPSTVVLSLGFRSPHVDILIAIWRSLSMVPCPAHVTDARVSSTSTGALRQAAGRRASQHPLGKVKSASYQ